MRKYWTSKQCNVAILPGLKHFVDCLDAYERVVWRSGRDRQYDTITLAYTHLIAKLKEIPTNSTNVRLTEHGKCDDAIMYQGDYKRTDALKISRSLRFMNK